MSDDEWSPEEISSYMFGPHRYICTCLDGIMTVIKHNPDISHSTKGTILSLCEEVRVLGQRMEDSLERKGGIEEIEKTYRKKKKELETLDNLIQKKYNRYKEEDIE